MIIIQDACPKCGCFDIRKDWGGCYCFKCGYREGVKKIKWSWHYDSRTS